MRGKRFIWFLIMIAFGLVLGLLYGWRINPGSYSDTTPETLRDDYKTDYVLMVAEVYHSDKNLEQASRRLGNLASLPPSRIATDAAVTARQLGYAAVDLDLMDQLVQALQGQTATPTSGNQP